MSSILSFPERGPWGNSQWRGNCSGHVYKELFERLKPKVFVDPMVGSGTSVQVAQEMGIEAYGLDLHSGFDAASDSILQTVGKPADLCLSHPPYGSMIIYSGEQWGKPHKADLSRCASDEDFHQSMQLVLMNQREATVPDGFYGTIIGDLRRNGTYVSYQAEMIARMPSDELAAVLIKAQHNCTSDRKAYGSMKLPFIMHEYIILWRKKAKPVLVVLSNLARQQYAKLSGTWKNIVRLVLIQLGGQADLNRIYQAVSEKAPDKLANNTAWREKIRQTLNQNAEVFKPIDRGVWAIA